MIDTSKYNEVLRNLGREYFIENIIYVPRLKEWIKEKGIKVSEPLQFFKLTLDTTDRLTMVIQSDIKEEDLDKVINSLSIRWSLNDNISNPSDKLNSVEKRLVFCFLKEYAKSVKDIGGDEYHEDEWVINQMENFGFFK